jgi:hypothetical protein
MFWSNQKQIDIYLEKDAFFQSCNFFFEITRNQPLVNQVFVLKNKYGNLKFFAQLL